MEYRNGNNSIVEGNERNQSEQATIISKTAAISPAIQLSPILAILLASISPPPNLLSFPISECISQTRHALKYFFNIAVVEGLNPLTSAFSFLDPCSCFLTEVASTFPSSTPH